MVTAAPVRRYHTLADMRASVLNGILRASLILGGIQTVVGCYEAATITGRFSALVVYVSIYALLVATALWKSLGPTLRGTLLLALIYAVATSELFHFGLTGITGLFYFALVVFAGVLFGLRVGAATILLSLGTICLATSVYVARMRAETGQLPIPIEDAIAPWFTTSVSFCVLSATVLVSITILLRNLDRASRESQELVCELRSEAAERERAESALRRSEILHRELVENVNSVILRMDREGRVTFVNEFGQRFFGFDGDALIGRNVVGAIVPETESTGRNLARMVSDMCRHPEEYVTGENENMRRNGERVWMAWTNRVLYGGGGHVSEILCVGTDITKRKRAEEALRQSETQSRILFEQAADAIYMATTDGRIVQANEQACISTQYSHDELLNMSIADLDVNYHPAAWGEYVSSLTPGHSVVIESLHRRKDGSIFPVEIKSAVIDTPSGIHVLGTARDLSERRRGEAERERLISAIEQAAEPIVITDPQGIIEFVNPAFERVTGYSSHEAIGESPRILKSGEHDDAFYQCLWDTIAGGKTWSGRLVNRRKDGQLYTEEAVISPVRDATGSIVNFVAVKRDVTEVMRLEEELRQSQKLEAIGQLTGGVAHDFNNLLQVIGGYTDLAADTFEPGHRSRELLDEVSKATERAGRLVSQLLLFSRRQVMRRDVIDLNEAVEEMLKMLRRIIGEHIHIEWIPAGQIEPIDADRGMVEQALMNLCVNARDAMPSGGRLVIETREAVIDGVYSTAYPWAKPGPYTQVSVTDTGCGMDNATLNRIFEPFFTTKEQGKGTGLGLATVYGIAKQHGGIVNAYSELGLGTTFKLYFPVSERNAAPEITEDMSAPGGSETILLAEDNESVRALAQQILEEAGYAVITASDGAQALAVFEQEAERIDIAILDVVMPAMGGRECFDRMRAWRPDLRAVFASGYSENSIHTNFVLDNGFILIEKPFARTTLLRTIRETLDRPA